MRLEIIMTNPDIEVQGLARPFRNRVRGRAGPDA
jgi:hypothetical protein